MGVKEVQGRMKFVLCASIARDQNLFFFTGDRRVDSIKS